MFLFHFPTFFNKFPSFIIKDHKIFQKNQSYFDRISPINYEIIKKHNDCLVLENSTNFGINWS
jgi:hypothetical protein